MAHDSTEDDALNEAQTLAITSCYMAIIDVLEEESPGMSKRIQDAMLRRIRAEGGAVAHMAEAMVRIRQ